MDPVEITTPLGNRGEIPSPRTVGSSQAETAQEVFAFEHVTVGREVEARDIGHQHAHPNTSGQPKCRRAAAAAHRSGKDSSSRAAGSECAGTRPSRRAHGGQSTTSVRRNSRSRTGGCARERECRAETRTCAAPTERSPPRCCRRWRAPVPRRHGAHGLRPTAYFAQVSRRAIVRLKTSRSGRVSGSTAK